MAGEYDLLVIGCGPAGQKAAIQAAKLGRRAAIVERRQVGGVCVMTGTIPSKTLREAVVYLTGLSQRGIYGQSYRVKEDITIEDLPALSLWWVTRSEWEGLLDVSGLETAALYGWFDRRPFDDASREFVWIARKPA